MAIMGASGGVVGSAQTDVTNPYETIPCGCVYCFVCIATRLEAEEGEGWTCLRCGDHVLECRPWAGDDLEAMAMPLKKKTVSFSDDEGPKESQAKQDNAVRIDETLGQGQAGSFWATEESDSGIDVSAN